MQIFSSWNSLACILTQTSCFATLTDGKGDQLMISILERGF